MDDMNLMHGNCVDKLKTIDAGTVHTCVTSPPYFGLRDYGEDEQIGLEQTPEEYVYNIVSIFKEIKRILRDDGTVWLNLGDSYSGSGKGSNPDGTPYKRAIGSKQSTNKGTTNGILLPQVASVIGLKPKNLIGIPWRVAFALQADGWYLRQDIIWSKPNAMPESVKDRCTKSHEYIFLLSKSKKYYYDFESIKEPACYKDNRESGMVRNAESYRKKVKYSNSDYGGGGTSFQGHSGIYKANGTPINPDGMRNKRSVWTVNTKPFKGAHFATFPEDLITPCILAGCPVDGIVLDPFMGSGTTGIVAQKYNRRFIGIELNKEYYDMSSERIGCNHYSMF